MARAYMSEATTTYLSVPAFPVKARSTCDLASASGANFMGCRVDVVNVRIAL